MQPGREGTVTVKPPSASGSTTIDYVRMVLPLEQIHELVDPHACLIQDREERLGLENDTGVHGNRDSARSVSMMEDDMASAASNLLPAGSTECPKRRFAGDSGSRAMSWQR